LASAVVLLRLATVVLSLHCQWQIWQLKVYEATGTPVLFSPSPPPLPLLEWLKGPSQLLCRCT